MDLFVLKMDIKENILFHKLELENCSFSFSFLFFLLLLVNEEEVCDYGYMTYHMMWHHRSKLREKRQEGKYQDVY